MGFYMMLLEHEKERFLKVSDPDIQEVFDEARELDSSLYISEYSVSVKNKFWQSRKIETLYNLYHSTELKDELRQIIAGSGDKKTVITYLYGVMNGVLSTQRL